MFVSCPSCSFSPVSLRVGGSAAGAGARAKQAEAKRRPAGGVADEQPSTFGVPAFKALRTTISRYVTPYDVATNRSHNDLPRLRQWLAAAGRDHIQPLIAFYHSDRTPRKLPSVKTYTADIKRFHRMFPHVALLQPWNEANRGYVNAGHGSYASPSAKQSAEYYLAVKHACPRCTVVGLDVLDSTNVRATVRYINEFKRDLGRSRATDDLGIAQLLRHQPLPLDRNAGGARRHHRTALADRDRGDRQARQQLPVQPAPPVQGDQATCSRWPASRGASPACTSSSGPAERQAGALRRRTDQRRGQATARLLRRLHAPATHQAVPLPNRVKLSRRRRRRRRVRAGAFGVGVPPTSRARPRGGRAGCDGGYPEITVPTKVHPA